MLRGFLFLFCGLAFLGLTALCWTDSSTAPAATEAKKNIQKQEGRSPASNAKAKPKLSDS